MSFNSVDRITLHAFSDNRKCVRMRVYARLIIEKKSLFVFVLYKRKQIHDDDFDVEMRNKRSDRNMEFKLQNIEITS